MDDCWYHVCALQQTFRLFSVPATAPPQRLAGDGRAWLCMPICLCTRLCKQIGMHSSSREALSALQARAVRGALVVLFIDAMCVFLGLSVLAYFLEDLGGSVLELGSLFATFAIFNIAASTWSGYASDKLGRRPVLIASTFGVSVGFLLTGTAQSVPWLFVARAWLGFWSGVASVGRAYIADVTSPSHRTDAMGKAGAVMMVGYAVGAPLGGTCMLDLRPSPACRPQP